MKVCYCDESGTGNEPIAVMVGIIVDSQRMHVTKDHWKGLLETLSKIVGKPVDEIHTRDFYSGNGIWHGLKGEKRSLYITAIFNWLQARRHKVVYVAVEKEKFFQSQKEGKIHKEISTLWRFMGLHILLCVQKAHQVLNKTKGHTIFIFDNEEKERMRFTDIIANPPSWTDSYYEKEENEKPLNQIIDVPYFGDSKEVHLLQVADFLAFFLRRHIEISDKHVEEKFEKEGDKISGWISMVKKFSLPPRISYPATGRCECTDLFYKHAPAILRDMGRRQHS